MERMMAAPATILFTEGKSRLSGFGSSQGVPGAFTLVEVILAVAIAAVMMGGAVLFLREGLAEDEFAIARQALEDAAQKARADALRTGQDRWVSLFANGVENEKFPPEVKMDLLTPQEISAGVRTWGKPPEKTGYPWFFSRYGWLEPVRIRLRTEGGRQEAYSFAALTGELIPEPLIR